MNILFYKLLAYSTLKEQADYILNSRDPEYTLENHIISTGYNPIEKLKELECDIDAQVLTTEIYDFIISNTRSDDIFEYIKELYDLIDVRFKFHGLYLTNQIKDYLLMKSYSHLCSDVFNTLRIELRRKFEINSGEVL